MLLCDANAIFLTALLEGMTEDLRFFVQRLPWPESPKNMVNEETTWTVIFNPRVCGDVDLEVGKCIRIHPPWYDYKI